MTCGCDHGSFEPADVVRIVTGIDERGTPSFALNTVRHTEQDPDQPVLVQMVGELDAHAVECVRTEMQRLEARDALVVDLEGVSFLDSAGLRSLQGMQAAVAAHGGSVRWHQPSRAVRALLSVLAVERLDVCGDATDSAGADERSTGART